MFVSTGIHTAAVDPTLDKVICLSHMALRGLSVQRFDLFTRGFTFRHTLSSGSMTPAGLSGRNSGVNSRGPAPDDVGVAWITHSWVLALVNAERLECNVCFPLVLWFEVCIFPVSHRAMWFGCIMLQLVWWQPPDLLWTSSVTPPLSPVGICFLSFHLDTSNICIDCTWCEPKLTGFDPLAGAVEDRQLSFACDLHVILLRLFAKSGGQINHCFVWTTFASYLHQRCLTRVT